MLRVQAELPNLSVIRGFIQDTAAALGFAPDPIMDMIQAVDEAVTNIVVHGYRGRPGDIEVEVSRERTSLVVCLRDRAGSFDPTGAPPPDLTLPLERRRLGGLGIYLMRQFTDALLYRRTENGSNELTLIRKQTDLAMEVTHEHLG